MKRDLAALAAIRQQISDARELVTLQDAEEILAARKNAKYLLDSHGLITAGFVVLRDPGYQSFTEYRHMVSDMRAGGFHCVRQTGGRGIGPRTTTTPPNGSARPGA